MAVSSDGKFFKLLPYYAPTSNVSEIANQLANERPMLGICLKRYGYDTVRKQPYRDGRKYVRIVLTCLTLGFRVVIPKFIELSNFVTDEDDSNGKPTKQYRLVFYSTVCHRGQYVHSGHYVTIVWDRQNDRYCSPPSDFELILDGFILMISPRKK